MSQKIVKRIKRFSKGNYRLYRAIKKSYKEMNLSDRTEFNRTLPHRVKTIYSSISELTNLQQDIMHLINDWVHKEKTPIPLKEIMTRMKEQENKGPTVTNAIHGLLLKGYIRESCIISNKTYYVMLRSI